MKRIPYVPLVLPKHSYVPPTPEEEAMMKAGQEKRLKEQEEFYAQMDREDAARKRKKAFWTARAKDRLLLKERELYSDQVKKLKDDGLSEKEARQKLGPFQFSGAKPFFGQQVQTSKSI